MTIHNMVLEVLTKSSAVIFFAVWLPRELLLLEPEEICRKPCLNLGQISLLFYRRLGNLQLGEPRSLYRVYTEGRFSNRFRHFGLGHML